MPDPALRPSANHPGRRGFNHAIFDAGDRWLLEFSDLYRGVLLDLGCGKRSYADFIEAHCQRYVGVDWGHSLHGLNADVVADLNRPLPFATGSVDTVISFSVMEHLKEPAQFLAESARIIRPGGWMVLQVPFMWHVHEAPHDYFRYTRHGLDYLMGNAGFVDVRIEPTTGFWTTWVLKLNYQLVRVVRGPRPWRWLSSALLWPVFWLDQWLAGRLDRIWPQGDAETAGYFAVGRKP